MSGGGSDRRPGVALLVRVLLVAAVILVLPANFTSDVRYYWEHAAGFGLHHLPYRDFLWEYPPLTVAPLLLMPLAHGSYVTFLGLFALAMVGCEYTARHLLLRAAPDAAAAGVIARWWDVVVVPLATIAYFRLDFVSVLPAVAAVVALEAARPAASRISVGAVAKLWPGVVAVGLVAERRWRALAVVGVQTVAWIGAWWAFSPSGFARFLAFRRGDGLQVESTGGGLLRLVGQRPRFVSGAWVVGHGAGWIEPAGVLAVGAAALVVASGRARWRVAPGRLVDLLGAVVAGVLVATRLLSPQFLVWLAPFVVLAAARGRSTAARLLAAASALTLFSMLTYRRLVFGSALWAVPVIARNGLLVAVAVSLARSAIERTSAVAPPAVLEPWPSS